MIYKIKKSTHLPIYYMMAQDETIIDTTLVNADGELQICAVDQFSGQPFMLNDNGFPMNDIMVFEEAQSDSVARAALERLQILHPDNMPVGTSPRDLLNSIVPANFSTPAEYLKIQSVFAKDWYNRIVSQKEKGDGENIQFAPSDEKAANVESNN